MRPGHIRRNIEEGRAGRDLGEQGRLGAGHPDLAASAGKPLEQGPAARGIEVGGDLVEQQDRPHAPVGGDEVGMDEDDREQQRLLLPGRAGRRRLALAKMGDRKVGAVRPGQGPPRRAVAAAPSGQRRGEVVLPGPAVEREAGAGEPPFRLPGEADR
jgi:hypothetical protein